ncbi:Meiotically up-regulated gene 72 protein [Cytospora mali]|uniref:Meiotically up-regulated gene 72 protein n=1 Tax=Cytospora mali TaxID=578113 RepID=A0A194V8I0_CYTMA|nr:Meiotically up-regulated gene 72 protein [Valsa mali var. pyri (nom. inval.)]
MADVEPMNVITVGGNAVSAFLSWRLQATNACDVTLVWKSGYDHVAQYGISFKSDVFGNERFKPRRVVKSPEEALSRKEAHYDYVVLCVKSLPDVYDLASVIESVVVPQHTCILVNTTNAIGVEAAIQERYPTNVVLSLVAGADIVQLGQSEFEHKGSTEVWIGPAKRNSEIPATIQDDMASALAMTLSSGQVDAKVSPNIRQQQYERVIGPIAFHPASVLFEATNYTELLAKPAVKPLISGIIDELLGLADAQGCKFDADYKQKVMDDMVKQSGTDSIMWQDFKAQRPMEVETYLGSPVKLAKEAGVKVPRIETLYAMLHHLNVVNRTRPKIDTVAAAGPPPPSGSPTSIVAPSPLPRMSMQPPARGMPPNGMHNGNGMPPRARPRGPSQMGPPPGMRRPSSNAGPINGYGRPPMNGPSNGYPRQPPVKRDSLDGADLEEFSHLVVYDDIPMGGETATLGEPDIALRERELQMRQRELALREQEMRMRRGPGGPPPGSRRGPPPRMPNGTVYDDDDEDDDFFDSNPGPPVPMIDPDNFDMMSVTSRKNRQHQSKTTSAAQFRKNPEFDNVPSSRTSRFRPSFGRNRSSQIVSQVPNLRDNILEDPLMGFTSNRYGAVDRSTMQQESRANSITSQRMDDLNWGPGGPGSMGMNGAFPRRASQSPGYAPSMRGGNGRPSPPNGLNGPMNGRPSPPGGVRQPTPQYPPGHGNAVAPQQVEQHAGVSNLNPPKKGKNVPSLTGSASASAGSGESTNLDTPSAHSSQSSLGPRPSIAAR